MAQTVDNLLAEIRREREKRTGVKPPFDISDLLTRGTVGGTRATVFDQPPEEDDELPDWLKEALGLDGGGGAGGGSFGGTRAGAELAQANALALLQEEARLGGLESDKARKFEREQELDRLKAERQRMFTDMLGTDPVRAVLFALGVGGEILPGGEQFADLDAMKGAQAQATGTKQALSKLVGDDIGLGTAGVTGLPTAQKAAAAFGGQAGGAGGNVMDQQKLLLSAFGVGAKKGKGRPGQSREETLRKISEATPQGTL